MTPTSARFEDLRQRVATLRARFAEVGGRAASAARSMTATTPPSDALLDDLTAVAREFADLREAVVEHAVTLPTPPDAASLTTLRSLDPVLITLERVEAERARRAAWDAARESALGVLDKVMALIHRDDKDFPALAECQAKAREIHAALSSEAPADLEHETTMVGGRVRPFVELISLAEGWNRLDDERCVFLQDAITQNFGRPLGLAALRGKLGHEGEIFGMESARGRGDYAAPAGFGGSPPPGYTAPGYPPAGPPAAGYAPAAATGGGAQGASTGAAGGTPAGVPGSGSGGAGVIGAPGIVRRRRRAGGRRWRGRAGRAARRGDPPQRRARAGRDGGRAARA